MGTDRYFCEEPADSRQAPCALADGIVERPWCSGSAVKRIADSTSVIIVTVSGGAEETTQANGMRCMCQT